MILELAAALTIGAAPTDSIRIARLQYEGGGDWYANPSSLPNLQAELRDRFGLPMGARDCSD